VLKAKDVHGLTEALMEKQRERAAIMDLDNEHCVLAASADVAGDEGMLPACAPSSHFQRLTINIALWVEWCRCRARAMRYSEEVKLLIEEMRWVWHSSSGTEAAGRNVCSTPPKGHNVPTLNASSPRVETVFEEA